MVGGGVLDVIATGAGGPHALNAVRPVGIAQLELGQRRWLLHSTSSSPLVQLSQGQLLEDGPRSLGFTTGSVRPSATQQIPRIIVKVLSVLGISNCTGSVLSR